MEFFTDNDLKKKKYFFTSSKKQRLTKTVLIFSSVIIFSFFISILSWSTNLFNNTIISHLKLLNGTLSFSWWQRPVVRAVYKIYIFNYTNVEEFQSGENVKLHVCEVGPFIYRETLIRLNPEINKHTVTYQEMRSYQWEGGHSDDEIVTVPNVPLFTAMAFSRDMNFLAQVSLTAILSTIRAKPFIKVPVKDFLWGYDDELFRIAKPVMAWQQNIPYDKFGILAFKTGISKDRLTIDTGSESLKNLGNTVEFNGEKIRKIWNDEKCDRIEGSDGSMFSPQIIQDRKSILKVYSKEMCRPIPLKYHSISYEKGIPSLRYKLVEDVFTTTIPHNACYCQKKTNETKIYSCSPKGIFNNSACNFGAPMLSSFPHFYKADKSLFNHVDGLKPDYNLHDTYIDIHPRLGVPIGGWSRVQINLEARKADAVPFMGNVKDGTILPILWIEVGIDKIPESIMNLLYHTHYTANAIEAGLKWGSLLIFISSISILGYILYDHITNNVSALHKDNSQLNKVIKVVS